MSDWGLKDGCSSELVDVDWRFKDTGVQSQLFVCFHDPLTPRWVDRFSVALLLQLSLSLIDTHKESLTCELFSAIFDLIKIIYISHFQNKNQYKQLSYSVVSCPLPLASCF